MTTPAPSLLDAALAMHDAGLCVLPAAEDGSKRPAVDWKQYQTQRPTVEQIRRWWGEGRTGIGVVCGSVSGGLEMTELEGRCVQALGVKRLRDLAELAGETELLDRLLGGCVVASPSVGLHILYRVVCSLILGEADCGEVAEIPGNTKLAATADHVTLAETRGEGGWVVTAPSHGHVHPSKKPWQVIAGGPETIPTISSDERERFHALVRLLDEREVVAPVEPSGFAPLSRPGGSDGVSPGDDLSARESWDTLMTEAGWRRAFTRGEVTFWTRPGKTHGISATTGYQGDWLYVFTSSTSLEPERTYTKFGFYAAWHHHGDHQAAAKALQARGYGKVATAVSLPVLPALNPATTVDATAGLEAVGAPVPPPQVFGLTDTGNARLLVAQYADRLRYVPERGAWMRWAGHRWAFDEAGEHMELAKDTLSVAAEVFADDKAAARHYRQSLSRRGVEAAVALARTDPKVVASATQLDAVAHLLCTPGGVVDLRTGLMTPPTPADLHTRSTLVAPDPSCPTPRWLAFLADTFGGDADLIGYVQRLAGYSATGDVSAHILPFLHGATGQNGKSVLMEVQGTLLGGYAGSAPGTFLTHGQSQHETEIARLAGLRFVVCQETERGARFAEAKVKMLTGGDELTARFMRKDHFSWSPTHHLWLVANDLPEVSAGGDSFWRRLRLIEFRHRVPDDRRIDGLAKLLVSEEGPGILAWIVAGAVAYYSGGLREPVGVKAATAQYAASEDDLGRFIAERLVVATTPEARAQIQLPTTTVTAAYHSWCIDEGVEPVSHKRFGMELRTRCGAETYRSNGRRFYLGVSLSDAGTPFAALTPNRIHY